MSTQNEPQVHVHQRIAEVVSSETGVDVSPEDVREILKAQTIGWADGVVPAVHREAREYGILIK